jgi:predicted extracellular nuclease
MGDFNAPPDNRVIRMLTANGSALSLMPMQDGKGSYKYHGNWEYIDLIFTLRSMMTGNASLRPAGHARVFAPDFLMTDDKTYLGKRPFRSYYGYKYEGGFSDHLPVIAEFIIALNPRYEL